MAEKGETICPIISNENFHQHHINK